MNIYQQIYEYLAPDDKLADNDPRKPDILAEVKAVIEAKTNRDAAKVIEWWGWDSNQALVWWVVRARKLFAQLKCSSYK